MCAVSATPRSIGSTTKCAWAAGISTTASAVKAQTCVATPLAQTARIAPLPEIRLQDTVVDYGASTKILVVASLEGDKYQPWLDGNQLKQARHGNGEISPSTPMP